MRKGESSIVREREREREISKGQGPTGGVQTYPMSPITFMLNVCALHSRVLVYQSMSRSSALVTTREKIVKASTPLLSSTQKQHLHKIDRRTAGRNKKACF